MVACVDFRWTSVTNVDGADTPQMCLIRPRFNSWLIFNFFVFLLSVCEHFRQFLVYVAMDSSSHIVC